LRNQKVDTDGVERRGGNRTPVDKPASWKVFNPELTSLTQLRILDVSKGGLKLCLPDSLKPGTLIQIRFKTAIAVGKVCYCLPVQSEFHIGVEIQEISPAASETQP
jgi:hypothetical protein